MADGGSSDADQWAGGAGRTSDTPGAARTAGVTLAVLVLWTGLAAARPEVTYHLAPALVVWVAPWTHREARLRDRLVATGGGLLAAVGGATILRGAGWLGGPVLFGGDVFGEAVLVSLAAGVLAALIDLLREPRRAT